MNDRRNIPVALPLALVTLSVLCIGWGAARGLRLGSGVFMLAIGAGLLALCLTLIRATQS